MRFCLFLLLLCIGACTQYSDPPIATIAPDAPTWPLAPDHLDYGALPR